MATPSSWPRPTAAWRCAPTPRRARESGRRGPTPSADSRLPHQFTRWMATTVRHRDHALACPLRLERSAPTVVRQEHRIVGLSNRATISRVHNAAPLSHESPGPPACARPRLRGRPSSAQLARQHGIAPAAFRSPAPAPSRTQRLRRRAPVAGAARPRSQSISAARVSTLGEPMLGIGHAQVGQRRIRAHRRRRRSRSRTSPPSRAQTAPRCLRAACRPAPGARGNGSRAARSGRAEARSSPGTRWPGIRRCGHRPTCTARGPRGTARGLVEAVLVEAQHAEPGGDRVMD